MDYAFERYKYHEMVEPKQPYINSLIYDDEDLANKVTYGDSKSVEKVKKIPKFAVKLKKE